MARHATPRRAVDIHAPNFLFQSLSLSGQETMAAAP